MTLRLIVDAPRWRRSVDAMRSEVGDLTPVVKGNGYGFGLCTLASEAARVADTIAVGNAHEAAQVAAVLPTHALLVLTPSMSDAHLLPPRSVPTVGSAAHVEALRGAGWTGAASVKLLSTMHRYGAAESDLPSVMAATRAAGITVTTAILHLPLMTSDDGGAGTDAEVARWLEVLDPALTLSISHVSPSTFNALRHRHPRRTVHLRSGTALWHGDRDSLRLEADVIDVRSVAANTPAGYRRRTLEAAGTLVMIGAGTANGVTLLEDGRSPFHHARRRLPLVEPPHMHTSMAFVEAGAPCPAVGEWVDVQRPLTMTRADDVVWMGDHG